MPEQEEEKKEEKREEKEGDGVTETKVKELIESALEPIKQLLRSGDNNKSDDDKGDGESDDDEAKKDKPRRRSYAAVEDEAESKIKDAVKAVLGEVEHEREHEHIRAEKKRAPTQKAPNKRRWSTKLMLGKYGED